MRGGEDPARIKKTHYIYLFLTTEKDVQVARNGGRGGGRGNSGNARKKTFIFAGGVPLGPITPWFFFRSKLFNCDG